MLNIDYLLRNSFEGSGDREKLQEKIDSLQSDIDNASKNIGDLIIGIKSIDYNSREELLAARALLMLYRDNLNKLISHFEMKSEVRKYYEDALKNNGTNFKMIEEAEKFLDKYFKI